MIDAAGVALIAADGNDRRLAFRHLASLRTKRGRGFDKDISFTVSAFRRSVLRDHVVRCRFGRLARFVDREERDGSV